MKTLKLVCSLFLMTVIGHFALAQNEDTLTHSHGMPSVDLDMKGKSGVDVAGDIELVEESNRLRVVAKIKGVRPNSTHGFHVHETGNCSASDAKSAGGHFDPDGNRHGSPIAKKHHAGDLGNVVANDRGEIIINAVFPKLNLKQGDKYSVLGRAIILHQNPDDMSSQPSGDAGARIACAEIPVSL